jgi:hypothetical protein
MNYYDGQQPTQPAQPAPVYQPPVPEGPNMAQPAPTVGAAPTQTQVTIRPSEPNSTSFVPDSKTREILSSVYPELSNALINIAIKKFSSDPDYLNYFVRDEFKNKAEAEAEQKQAKPNNASESTPASNNVTDFAGW